MSSPFQLGTTIREDYRFFLCQFCEQEVAICSSCDRGQCYCSEECSSEARRQSLLAAGRRYQQTDAGRANHSARQATYLQRQSEKDDASGFPDAERVVHTGVEDADADLSKLVGRFEPAYEAAGRVRCCVCGAQWLSRRAVEALRRRR